MEMSYLRWILLGVAIIVVAGVYFFSRARKKTQPSSQLNAADKVPSFSAKEVATGNEWMNGVGPVRIVSEPEKNPQVDSIQANGPAEVTVKKYPAGKLSGACPEYSGRYRVRTPA